MTVTAVYKPDTERRRALLAAALAFAGGTHTVEDVEDAITRGEVTLWDGPNSVIVTEIDYQPRQTVLNVFLAAGVMA